MLRCVILYHAVQFQYDANDTGWNGFVKGTNSCEIDTLMGDEMKGVRWNLSMDSR